MSETIFRAMESKEFKSVEEAQEYANRVLQDEAKLPKPTPLQEAQDLIDDAWDEENPKHKHDMAKEALRISPDCADAYVILAEGAATLEEARSLFEKGVEVATKTLGPETFKKDVGHFWGVHSTRPYMRTRAGLALCLWRLDEQEAAIKHCQDMLRLNPDDNMGLRYVLAGWLAEVDDDAALAELLDNHNDSSASLEYARALWTFRTQGRSGKARKALEAAFETNRHVPDFLLGEKRLPDEVPDYFRSGDETEAVDAARDIGNAWRKTKGALDWLGKAWQQGRY